MSEDEKINKAVDSFSEYIRKRLNAHLTPPDENCWNEIEQRLQRKRKHFPVRIGIIIAASMLATVLLVYNIIINDKNETQYAFVEKNDIFIQNPVSEDINTGIIDEVEEKDDKVVEGKKDAGFSKKRIVNNTLSVISDMQEKEAKEQEESTIQTTEERSTETPEKEETKSADINKNRYSDEYQRSGNLLAYDLPSDKVNRKKSWQINAGFGTGTGAVNSSLNFSGRPPSNDYFGDGSGNNNLGQQPGYETTKNITNIDYAIPISAGLTVRRKLTKTIGIETGLIYTYLSTDYDITGNLPHRATLKLHYLGIPANLIVNLWDKRQWNLYLSGGGMVEKGLQAVSKQKYHISNNSQQSKNRSNISGLQWSLNGGVGISYNLYKDVNLYLEPVVSYYFDCNQPLSKRTEDPLNFSIRAGIRYDF